MRAVAEPVPVAPLALHVYARGQYPRGTLASLWALMEAEGATARVFATQVVPETPHSWRGDLVQFVRLLEPEVAGSVVTLIAADPETQEPAGLFWFSDLVPGQRACVNVWLRRKFWGPVARATGPEVVRFAFERLGLQALWGFTPWPEAVRAAEAAGLRRVTALPGWLVVDGAPRDLLVLRLTRAEWQEMTGDG